MLKVGSEFSFTLTPLGEVRDVSLSESTRKRLAERPAAGRGFSDDALRSSIPAAPLPRGELKPGQSWTEKPTFIDSFFFPTRVLATKYRYAGPIERDGSRLDVIELEFESDLTPAHEPPYPTRYRSFVSRGKIVFDATAGHMIEEVRETNSEMTLMIAGREREEKQERVEKTTLSSATVR